MFNGGAGVELTPPSPPQAARLNMIRVAANVISRRDSMWIFPLENEVNVRCVSNAGRLQ